MAAGAMTEAGLRFLDREALPVEPTRRWQRRLRGHGTCRPASADTIWLENSGRGKRIRASSARGVLQGRLKLRPGSDGKDNVKAFFSYRLVEPVRRFALRQRERCLGTDGIGAGAFGEGGVARKEPLYFVGGVTGKNIEVPRRVRARGNDISLAAGQSMRVGEKNPIRCTRMVAVEVEENLRLLASRRFGKRRRTAFEEFSEVARSGQIVAHDGAY